MAETEDMVERATNALLAKVPEGYGMTKAEAVEYSRAVIEAMREPTGAMIGAVGSEWGDALESNYRLLIDAALQGKG